MTAVATKGRRGLSGLSLNELQREIMKRERTVSKLERKRAKLLKKLADLDTEILENGGSGRGGKGMGARTRARNESSLMDALAALLKGKTMGVTEAAEAVQKAGYRTTSPNFRTMVNAALLNKKLFKRLERGKYTAV